MSLNIYTGTLARTTTTLGGQLLLGFLFENVLSTRKFLFLGVVMALTVARRTRLILSDSRKEEIETSVVSNDELKTV
jgi:hypothetical protein